MEQTIAKEAAMDDQPSILPSSSLAESKLATLSISASFASLKQSDNAMFEFSSSESPTTFAISNEKSDAIAEAAKNSVQSFVDANLAACSGRYSTNDEIFKRTRQSSSEETNEQG